MNKCSFLVRIKRAWAAFWCPIVSPSTAFEAEIATIINRLRYAANIKDLPMAILDDINTLDQTIAAALAAKDAEAADNVSALADAKAQNEDLSKQLSDADAAVVALNTKYAVATPVADTPEAPEAPAA